MTAALTSAVLITPTAAAAPSCVAQSVQTEHQLYATAWGHDLIAYLATHPEVLADVRVRQLRRPGLLRRAPEPHELPPRPLATQHPPSGSLSGDPDPRHYSAWISSSQCQADRSRRISK